VVAEGGDVVAGRELVYDLDIGGESGAGEDALEQIVTKERRVRHSAGESSLESVDVVDALAGIGAFAEQILVHVRDGGGVGVDTTHAGEDALEERALAADGQRRRDARLQHRMAFHDPAGDCVEAGPVERMRHLPDQPADRVTRQLRVGVERDDVADIRGHGGRLPVEAQERGVGRAAQELVQFVKLAALALPAHPSPLACVPNPPAVEQQEALAAGRRAVAPVEPSDALHCSRKESPVTRDVLGRGIDPI